VARDERRARTGTTSPKRPAVTSPAVKRRPPPPRISPERLAAERGGALEGLDWLRRQPESRASPGYLAVRLLARAILFGVLRFRIESSGREHLPPAGYLLVGAAHRGWMDPFVVLHALPAQPRAWFLGSGPSTFTSPWREWLIRWLGGLLPVWRGGVGVKPHVASARAVVGNGGVFVQMPEGTVSGPPGQLGPFRIGVGLIALRTAAPIVPFAFAGTEELYIGKRMASRILPATSVERLLGADWDGILPAGGSREELALARRVTDALAAIIGPVVEALHPMTVDPPSRPRRLRRRLTWLLLRPGRLDRD
jgi:1-acyl-sn-glycerol-3-phosphate acyltransferase